MNYRVARYSNKIIHSVNNLLKEPSGYNYPCHKGRQNMPIYGIHVCNIVMVMGKKDCMWESPSNSHAVAIQWVHMVMDPLATILDLHSGNIITIMIFSRDMQS